MAIVASKISAYLRRRENVLTFILGAILINTGVALHFHMSPLLSNMFFGAVLVNIEKDIFPVFLSQ